MKHQPDRWVVVSIPGYDIYKVFGTWLGGYISGDAWRLNSGITKVEETEDYFLFHGSSGSIYECRKGAYGTSAYSASLIPDIAEVLPQETDWTALDYGG